MSHADPDSEPEPSPHPEPGSRPKADEPPDSGGAPDAAPDVANASGPSAAPNVAFASGPGAVPEPDADATLYAMRRAAPDDDATLLSTRGDIGSGAFPLPGRDATDDATLMAPHPARAAQGPARTRSGTLPPDVPMVEVDRGHFGEQPTTYTPRRLPPAVSADPPVPTPIDGFTRPPTQIPEPARHREAQRHRRLILTAVIVAAGAAALTAAIVGVIALARGLS